MGIRGVEAVVEGRKRGGEGSIWGRVEGGEAESEEEKVLEGRSEDGHAEFKSVRALGLEWAVHRNTPREADTELYPCDSWASTLRLVWQCLIYTLQQRPSMLYLQFTDPFYTAYTFPP